MVKPETLKKQGRTTLQNWLDHRASRDLHRHWLTTLVYVSSVHTFKTYGLQYLDRSGYQDHTNLNVSNTFHETPSPLACPDLDSTWQLCVPILVPHKLSRQNDNSRDEHDAPYLYKPGYT